MGPIGRAISVGLCAAAFLTAVIGGALAQDADKGRTEFMENCAGCHGADAKGAGTLGAKLKTKPTDLTLLAKRNHGNSITPPFTKWSTEEMRVPSIAAPKCRFGVVGTNPRRSQLRR